MSILLLSAVVAGTLISTAPAPAQAPNVVTRESTVTGTVASVQRSTRVVTFRKESNVLESVYVDPKVAAFDDLKVGDVVTVRYVESVVVQVRRDAKLSEPRDTLTDKRLLEGIRPGDRIEITLTRERAVDIKRKNK